MSYRVFDVIHCDALDFTVTGPDATRENFISQDAMAKELCAGTGLLLETYGLFQRIPVRDRAGKIVAADVKIRSGRWVVAQQG
jgi:hypothetical protein